MMLHFERFPKIKRLDTGLMITVTEKIDGTNGQILIAGNIIVAGSRSHFVYPASPPDSDNYGFAAWVLKHHEELLQLGEGRHFGEWYGHKIQRGYGLDTRHFALFNTFRPADMLPDCCEQVPILYQGIYQGTEHLMQIWEDLIKTGSRAHNMCGYPRPEGLVVYFHELRTALKMPIWK